MPRLLMLELPYMPSATPIQVAMPHTMPTSDETIAARRVCRFHTRAKAVGNVPGLQAQVSHSQVVTSGLAHLPDENAKHIQKPVQINAAFVKSG